MSIFRFKTVHHAQLSTKYGDGCSSRCWLQVLFNPKDTNTFASASLDRTIKVSAAYNMLWKTVFWLVDCLKRLMAKRDADFPI